ncbi:MAG TPA: flagellar assembly peptidoglycan hydrolase FlgJ, partial [Cellvibrionaceae bacterium]
VFADDNFLNSSETEFYRDMYDQQLSLSMASGKGIGIAEAFYQQLMRAYGDAVDEPQAESEANTLSEQGLGFNLSTAQRAETKVSQVNGTDTTATSFIDQIRPYANWAATQLNVDPKAIMAQAALETGWGEHIIRDNNGASSHNLFNIKATAQWTGKHVETSTTEYEAGVPKQVQADFRRYDSLFSAFSDYVELLQKPRYQQALAAGKDTNEFAEQLQQAGYATDPEYAQKIQRIVQSDRLSTNTVVNHLAVNLDLVERR